MIGKISGWTPDRITALLDEQSGFVSFPMPAILNIVEDCERQLAAAQARIRELEEQAQIDALRIATWSETVEAAKKLSSDRLVLLAKAQERIRQLEASQRWEKAPDGKITPDTTLSDSGRILWLDDEKDSYLSFPVYLRIFRYRPQEPQP